MKLVQSWWGPLIACERPLHRHVVFHLAQSTEKMYCPGFQGREYETVVFVKVECFIPTYDSAEMIRVNRIRA